jgi:beta-phosphoglucomutase-like phosphatase (HAD superfamily)
VKAPIKAIDAILFQPVGVVVDEAGEPYPDAASAIAELDTLGVKLIEVPSASAAALREAVSAAELAVDRVIYLTDNEAGIRAAKEAGVAPVLMMNDPDEAMRLTAFDPAGGIVSLLELPDFVRFVSMGQQ